jgi:hypothetical protein
VVSLITTTKVWLAATLNVMEAFGDGLAPVSARKLVQMLAGMKLPAYAAAKMKLTPAQAVETSTFTQAGTGPFVKV